MAPEVRIADIRTNEPNARIIDPIRRPEIESDDLRDPPLDQKPINENPPEIPRRPRDRNDLPHEDQQNNPIAQRQSNQHLPPQGVRSSIFTIYPSNPSTNASHISRAALSDSIARRAFVAIE